MSRLYVYVLNRPHLCRRVMFLADLLDLRSNPQLYTAFVVVVCCAFYYVNSLFALRNTTRLPEKKSFCIVTAHPDDECMFFSPTINALVQSGNQVSILCLSTGDAEGIGKVRSKELERSAKILRFEQTCLDHDGLPDSMSTKWDSKVIVKQIQQHIKSRTTPIDGFITFDEFGVSSHPNHISILPALRQYRASLQGDKAQHPTIWKLLTTSLPRKYIGIGDVLPTLIMTTWRAATEPGKRKKKKENHMCVMSDPIQAFRGQRAMVRGHRSQMRWFRWFWVVIGRYMYINELKKVR